MNFGFGAKLRITVVFAAGDVRAAAGAASAGGRRPGVPEDGSRQDSNTKMLDDEQVYDGARRGLVVDARAHAQLVYAAAFRCFHAQTDSLIQVRDRMEV